MAIYDRICCICGANFKGGPRAWYCPACREERRKEREAKYRKGKSKRPIGSKDICENCGEEYTVYSGLQKYCPKCQPIMLKKVDREQSLEYYNKNKDKINPVRNEKRRTPQAQCVICGKLFDRKGQAVTCSEECRKIYINSNYNNLYGPRYRENKKSKK